MYGLGRGRWEAAATGPIGALSPVAAAAEVSAMTARQSATECWDIPGGWLIGPCDVTGRLPTSCVAGAASHVLQRS